MKLLHKRIRAVWSGSKYKEGTFTLVNSMGSE